MAQTPQAAAPNPGWYPDPADQRIMRWWDGRQWTTQTQAAQTSLLDKGQDLLQQGRDAIAARQAAKAADLAARGILFSFESHTSGRNARVNIYENLVEWVQPKGVLGKKDTETLPVAQILSVASRTDGLSHAIMSIRTAGGMIDFRASRSDIERARQVLNDLVLKAVDQSRSARVTVEMAPPAAPVAQTPPAPSIADQLGQLAELHTRGVLSDDEFAAAKARLLGL